MTDTSFAEKLKIDITVLVTSIHQREIAIQTANYYSEICSEVIFVDEQQPHLSESDISALKKKAYHTFPIKLQVIRGCMALKSV